MLVREIFEKLRSGVISLDTRGHRIGDELENWLLETYDAAVRGSQGAHDNQWNLSNEETMEQQNAYMRAFYLRKIEDEVVPEQNIDLFYEIPNCFACGERTQWILSGNFLRLKTSQDRDCLYAVSRPTKGTITIRSRLVFANVFRHVSNCPNGENQFSPKWSMNYDIGRENVTRYLCEQHNVAYGQMGNMSVGIFVHPNKKSIIIGDPYLDDMENNPSIEDHLFAGDVCLSVWRWEATDMNTLGKEHYEKLIEQEVNLVEVDVEHGLWDFTHFYREENPEYEMVYARMNLRE